MFSFSAGMRRRRYSSRQTTSPRALSVERLETRSLLTTLVWSAAPALPAAQTGAVAILASDNAVHLLGGDSATPTVALQLSATATAWTTGFDIDTQRNDLGAVRSGNAVFLFGGTNGNEGSDEVLSYDFRLGDSQDLEKMNQVRYDHGFAADSLGRAYAIGGIGVFDDGEIWSQVERYTPSTNTWAAVAPLPRALRGMAAIGDGNGNIFVFGGSSTLDDSGIQNTTYRYDVATDAWSTVFPMPVATRDSAVMMDEHGAIYVLGGMTATGATDAVQVYDPATNSWTANSPLPAPVYSHAAAYDSLGRIIVAGGFDAAGTPTAAVLRSQRLNIAETAPVITSSPVVNASFDTFYSYGVNATGNPAASYSLSVAPTGMTIDAATGVISWQPVAGQPGVQSVTVVASNTVGSVEQSFDITVLGDTIAPTVPGNFALQSATETSLTFDWTASTDASGVARYEIATAIYTGPRFGKRWVYTVVETVPSASTSHTITGLAPVESHRYAIRAIDTTGLTSAWSPRILAQTLSLPTLTFQYGSQTSGTIHSPAKTPLTLFLRSTANPAAEFSLVNGPADMVVDPATGVVQWTPTVADVGLQDVTFRATNVVASADLTISFDIIPDAPQLSVQFNSGTGQNFAVAGALFTAHVRDGSSTPSTYELTAFPTGMTIDSATGLISWTPTGDQGGTQSVTVRGTNAGGVTDLTFNVPTRFTGAVTGVNVTGTSLAEPTVHWVAPTGEGAELVSSYQVHGFAQWGVGRTRRTHTVDYTVPASETSVLMTGLVTGRSYALTITPFDAAGNPGLVNTGTDFVSAPALPVVRWTVNGAVGAPGPAIAEQPVEIALTDQQPDPSDIVLISGPAGLTFDPATKVANWTPTAADVNVGYANTNVVFEATNSVGTVSVTVPVHIYFSGAVKNLSATKFGTTAATATWDAPTDNVTPIAAYQITMHWTWSGRNRSRTWTIDGDSTSVGYSLIPTGAVSHRGVTVIPIDANGNLGVSSGQVLYGAATNNLPPIAVDDAYDAVEDTTLTVNMTQGVRANDIDTDNTPFINPLTARLVTGPSNGVLALNAAGSFTYTPNANFHGDDTFTYVAYDGRFNSDPATVTISVAPVNDTPMALDDYYTVDQDSTLTVAAAAGVLANDADVDGDVLTATTVDNPANGSITLNPDGSFSYTPNAGFSGTDTFSYVASDGVIGSRTASVSVVVNPLREGTKFVVVDPLSDTSFEYAADGSLVEANALPRPNRAAVGVATNMDGSLVWTIDRSHTVFVYNDAGQPLGSWQADGLSQPQGIATDGTDIWIVDRSLDVVLRFAGAAALRSGDAASTDSFPLQRGNRSPRGITTDGAHLWVVTNYGAIDRVFKYDVSGNYIGRWTIDSANAKPSGITIDPNDVRHIWIVDSESDRVYQYTDAAVRTRGTQSASTRFALDAANTNPQGIADPRSPASSEPRTIPTAAAAVLPRTSANSAGVLLFGDSRRSTFDSHHVTTDHGRTTTEASTVDVEVQLDNSAAMKRVAATSGSDNAVVDGTQLDDADVMTVFGDVAVLDAILDSQLTTR